MYVLGVFLSMFSERFVLGFLTSVIHCDGVALLLTHRVHFVF